MIAHSDSSVSIIEMLEDVKEFHRKFKLPITKSSHHLSQLTKAEYITFRKGFLYEELHEATTALTIEDFIDAQLDLAYVALGTILYLGLEVTETTEIDHTLFPSLKLSEVSQRRYCGIKKLIKEYVNIDYNENSHNRLMCTTTLLCIPLNCFSTIHAMGFTPIELKEMWSILQHANMAKELATPENPSSRGNTSGDLIKPEGWEAPSYGHLFTV